MKPREYQTEILNQTIQAVRIGKNPIIELDCGLGKRFLQLALIKNYFSDLRIILLLQASTSLYETYNYLIKHAPDENITIIDSRIPSILREKRLRENRVILCLPQTLENTLKNYPNAGDNIDLLLINEVDQILTRMSTNNSLKIPYPKLLQKFLHSTIIGMSGTLRDEHYVLNKEQIKVKKELESLTYVITNSTLIAMDSLVGTDLQSHVSMSKVIPTAVDDTRISLISMELELYIQEVKEEILAILHQEDPQLYNLAKSDFSILFGPLPIEPNLMKKFHSGYLTRKYLWAMSGRKSAIHLIRYGLDEKYVWDSISMIPGKFLAVMKLVKKYNKSVVLCSYLDTVNTLDELLRKQGLQTIIISGEVSQNKRAESLDIFRAGNEQMVAILSNVGERDLDIPEAELLVIFDLINTTKTVYQKLKRSRGGECRILYYSETKEVRKAKNVIEKISEKYPWSTEICPIETLSVK